LRNSKETRGIGLPTLEDKVLQRAGVMLLEPIYEQDFKWFSYGFRPGRSAHEALASIWSQATHQAIQGNLARRGDPTGISWERMNRLLDFYHLPGARVVHSIYAAKP
jgi:hypothetical protein